MKVNSVTLTACLALLAVGATANHNFLLNLPQTSNNTADSSEVTITTNSEYFISQRLELNWVEAFMYCKSNGLKLARPSSDAELDDLLSMLHDYFDSRDVEVLFDGSSLPQILSASACSSCDMHEQLVKAVSNISCTKDTRRFLCESISERRENDAPLTLKHMSLPNQKSNNYLKHLGDYAVENGSSHASKSYFVSGSEMEVSAKEGVKLCQSMDMSLASPRNQQDYDNIRNLLRSSRFDYVTLLIEAYRSEIDENVWMSSGEKVYYEIAFGVNQPDNYNNKEDCVVFTRDYERMSDVPCTSHNQILCERDNKAIDKHDQKEMEKFMRIIYNIKFSYNITTLDRTIQKNLYESQNFLKTTWIGARQICKSFGMDLFVTESEYEFKMFKERIGFSHKYYHFGFTDLNADQWYSIASGNALDYDIAWSDSDWKMPAHCSIINNTYGLFKSSCTKLKTNFVCQEVLVHLHDEQIESGEGDTSQSPETENFEKKIFSEIHVSSKTTPLESADTNFDEPTIILDSSACSDERNFFDANGNYLKTACQISYGMRQSDACLDIGMNLFIVDSSGVEQELLSFATSIFGSGRGSTLWINGKKGSDGKWYTNGPEKNQLMNGIAGITDDDDDGGYVDDTTSVTDAGSESEENVDETTASNVETTKNYFDDSDTDDISDEWSDREQYELYREILENRRQKRSAYGNYDHDCLILSASGPFIVSKTSCDKSMYSFCEYKKSEKDQPKQQLSTTTTTTTTPSTTATSTTTTTTPSTTTLSATTTSTTTSTSSTPLISPPIVALIVTIFTLRSFHPRVIMSTFIL